MNFLKLPKEEAEDLFNFLVNLKHSRWIVTDPKILMEVYEWHVKITGLYCCYEGKGGDSFCYMARDLCLYFKKEIVVEKKQKCTKCRRLKPIDDFLGNKYCKICQKKKIPTRTNR